MGIIRIKSVGDFLIKINKYDLSECISRGESKKYPCIQSGVFRTKNPRKNTWAIQQYYNLIGNTLTELQKTHLTAFSQHYGIPTNLIDFTYSPLVSLFFACQNADISEKGYVHFIKEMKLIDISDNVEFINEKNYLEQILSFSDDFFNITIDFINNIRDMYLFNNDEDMVYLETLINYYIHLAKKSYKTCLHTMNFVPKINFIELDYDLNYKNLAKQIEEQYDDILNEKQCKFLDYIYEKCEHDGFGLTNDILYFLILLKAIHKTFFPTGKLSVPDIILPFYVAYKPPLIVSRIENQASVFIQQQYLDFTQVSSSTYIIEPAIQKIKPDKIFEITCKKEILSELDRIGINEKFIFNDYDSIAHYVKQKIYT